MCHVEKKNKKRDTFNFVGQSYKYIFDDKNRIQHLCGS